MTLRPSSSTSAAGLGPSTERLSEFALVQGARDALKLMLDTLFSQDVNHYHALRQSLCDWSIQYSGKGHIDSLGCTGPDQSPPTTSGHLLWDKKNGGGPGGHGDPFSFRTNNEEPYAVSKHMEPVEIRRHFPLGF